MQNQYQTFPTHQNCCDGDKFSCSRILVDGDFQLTENWSAKILVEESQRGNTLFPRSSGKKIPEKPVQKIFEHLLRSLQICSCPYVAVARSLQILKEKRLTDLYRLSRKAQHGYTTLKTIEKVFDACSTFTCFHKGLTLIIPTNSSISFFTEIAILWLKGRRLHKCLHYKPLRKSNKCESRIIASLTNNYGLMRKQLFNPDCHTNIDNMSNYFCQNAGNHIPGCFY